MKLLSLVLLLSVFSSLTLTEVVKNLNHWKSLDKCGGFFIRNPKKRNEVVTPTVFKGHQYKTICQRWKNKYRFATVYDTENRIPVYSAYTFSQKEKTKRCTEWKIEPQLDNVTVSNGADVRDMMDSRKVKDVSKIKNQAVNSDYTRSGYTRGHVFPRLFGADQDQADSTFTLTNVAPQTNRTNQEWERKVETPMLRHITDSCKLDRNHKAYIVTGVIPDKQYDKRINVPSHFWSVFCCTSKTNSKELIGKAYIAEQVDFKLRQPSIDNLNKRLTELYKKRVSFNVFPGLTVKDIKPNF